MLLRHFFVNKQYSRLLLSESDNVIDDLQTKIKERLQNNYANDVEEIFWNLEKKHQEYKNKLTRKRDKKRKTLEKNREIFMSTNTEVQREKAEICNSLNKEELLTDINKKQISEEFITDNRQEKRKRKIKKELINDSSHQKSQLYLSDRTLVIKKAGKGYCVFVWDHSDYIKEAKKQVNDANIYKDVCFNA